MKLLAHGTPVKLAGWSDISVPVGTARGFAAEYQEDTEAAHERALKNGHHTAWTMFAGTALYGDRVYGAAKAAERKQLFESAVLLVDGETVDIEGEQFTVKVIKRNEKHPVNSDPIHFIKVR